jgi:mannose-6-phosphate isomerase class I
MTEITHGPWQVQDELIEQPSWGGRYIIDLKGLSDDAQWQGKKVGQSYELSKESKLIDPGNGQAVALKNLIMQNAVALLGQPVLDAHGSDLSLLIKLTQAKGNSFQVHLPEGKTLGHWVPKPEAWFYLAPGLYTFGLKAGTDYTAFSHILHTIDEEMHRLSEEVKSGRRTVEDARAQSQQRIQTLDPYAYINIVDADTDDVIDLTAGGIHHSWEQDDARFPDGNLVYEVQLDVPDELCSMRGFDKGKFLDDGGVRPTHVTDYLATVEQDPAHNELSRHIRKPQVIEDLGDAKTEMIFHTPYFNLDRLTVASSANLRQSLAGGFHHLFVHQGSAKVGELTLAQGRSYVLPASMGEYTLQVGDAEAILLKTYLPVK